MTGNQINKYGFVDKKIMIALQIRKHGDEYIKLMLKKR